MSVTVSMPGDRVFVYPDADLVRPAKDSYWICKTVPPAEDTAVGGYGSFEVYAHVIPEPGMVIYYDDNKPLRRAVKL